MPRCRSSMWALWISNFGISLFINFFEFLLGILHELLIFCEFGIFPDGYSLTLPHRLRLTYYVALVSIDTFHGTKVKISFSALRTIKEVAFIRLKILRALLYSLALNRRLLKIIYRYSLMIASSIFSILCFDDITLRIIIPLNSQIVDRRVQRILFLSYSWQ